ncbi:hypothetical protein [Vogesella sp. LIG4]|uniref:hypothetical protein n=1 Tax=Vogesella sp. LIG4 TaxID=1192162 RepID=UPI0012FE4E2B|nr:hypothetical protein [Vogesella sp. LIG4]
MERLASSEIATLWGGVLHILQLERLICNLDIFNKNKLLWCFFFWLSVADFYFCNMPFIVRSRCRRTCRWSEKAPVQKLSVWIPGLTPRARFVTPERKNQ